MANTNRKHPPTLQNLWSVGSIFFRKCSSSAILDSHCKKEDPFPPTFSRRKQRKSRPPFRGKYEEKFQISSTETKTILILLLQNFIPRDLKRCAFANSSEVQNKSSLSLQIYRCGLSASAWSGQQVAWRSCVANKGSRLTHRRLLHWTLSPPLSL